MICVPSLFTTVKTCQRVPAESIVKTSVWPDQGLHCFVDTRAGCWKLPSSVPGGSVGRAAWTEHSGGASGDGLLADADASPAEGLACCGGACRAPGGLQDLSGRPAGSPKAGMPTSPSRSHCKW